MNPLTASPETQAKAHNHRRPIAGQMLEEYDAQTIEYLRMVGVDDVLLRRVARGLAGAWR